MTSLYQSVRFSFPTLVFFSWVFEAEGSATLLAFRVGGQGKRNSKGTTRNRLSRKPGQSETVWLQSRQFYSQAWQLSETNPADWTVAEWESQLRNGPPTAVVCVERRARTDRCPTQTPSTGHRNTSNPSKLIFSNL